MSSESARAKIFNALILARHNIALTLQWAGRMDYETLSADVMRCYAIQYAFINLAEAVKDVPEALLTQYNSSSYWRDIVDFRNHLAHTYDDRLDHRIMDTIHSDIPALDQILKKILDDLEAGKS